MKNAQRFAILLNIIFAMIMIGWLIVAPKGALIFLACYLAFDFVAALIITVAKLNAQYALRPIDSTATRI